MNAAEARKLIKTGEIYKYVATLVPPMLYAADIMDGITHSDIGERYGLITGNGSFQDPYKPKDRNNFKAGGLTVDANGGIKSAGVSRDFDDVQYTFTPEELKVFFENADIMILHPGLNTKTEYN